MQTAQSKHKKWHEKIYHTIFFPHWMFLLLKKKTREVKGKILKEDLGKCDPTHLTRKTRKKMRVKQRWAALNFVLCQGINRLSCSIISQATRVDMQSVRVKSTLQSGMMKRETSVDVHETFTFDKKKFTSCLQCFVKEEGSQRDLILFVYSNQVRGKFSHRLHFNRPYYELLLSSPYRK